MKPRPPRKSRDRNSTRTWRQLAAMAKRQGLRIEHNDAFVGIYLRSDPRKRIVVHEWLNGHVDDRQSDRILRAMVEAALEVGR